MERMFTSTQSNPGQKLKPFVLIFMLAAVLAGAVYPGSGMSPIFGLAVIAVGIAAVLFFSKSILCLLLICIPAAVIWYYTGNIVYAALLCSAVVTTGVGAFLLKTTRSPWLLTIVPAAYLAALAISGKPILSLFSLVFFPAAYVLAASASGNTGRLSVVCRVATVFVATGLVAVVIWILISKGSLSITTLRETANSFFGRLSSYYTSQFADIASQYEALGADINSLTLTPSDAKLYAAAVFGIVPALVIIIVNILSFASYQITMSLFGKSGQLKYLTGRSLSFSMSWISALVFIIAYLVMLVTSYSGSAMVSLIAENIYLILLPGLVFTGVLVMLGKGGSGKRHIFWLIATALLIFISPNLAMAISAFVGSMAIIFANLRKLMTPPEES